MAVFPICQSAVAGDAGSFRALCVGLKYPGTRDGLRFTTDDVRRVADAFRRASGYETDRCVVDLLVDDDPGSEKPTVREVRKRLAALVAEADEADRLVFYFSGHGILGEAGQSLLVCSGDGQRDKASHLPLSEVRDMLARSRARDKLVVIDACHSGGKSPASGTLSPDNVASVMGAPSAAKGSGDPVAWLVSCDAEEKS